MALPHKEYLNDLVVVIPGIMGSALRQHDRDVWALSGTAIADGLRTLARNVEALALPPGIGHSLPQGKGEGEPNDGVQATALIGGLHVIPGVWSPVKGYAELVATLRDRFAVVPDENLILFPYDWRLSNAVSARRLRDTVIPALERWRKYRQDAKLILVCHSMGGLVARWFLEVLGGAELTRWLVTIATPYRGSVDALSCLVNGVSKGLGPLRKDLTGLVRTFPSMYELLPTYECIQSAGGLVKLESVGSGLNPEMLAASRQFHERIAECIRSHPSGTYKIVAIKGIHQPTFQSARFTADGVEAIRSLNSTNYGGDGVVPRPSAHPPEWENEASGYTIWAAQRHAAVQTTDTVLTQLYGLLTTDRLGQFMGGAAIGADIPHLIRAEETLTIDADADPLVALTATVTPHGATSPARADIMANLGDGRYRAEFADLPPGPYDVTVGPADPRSTLGRVSDSTLVWRDEE